MKPKTQTIKVKKQTVLHQTKKLCTAKKTVNRIKGQPVEWDKILADHIYDKWLMFKIYKGVL